MNRIDPQIEVTADGSISIRDQESGELFHNRAGAYTEALRNFVEPLDLPQWAAGKPSLSVLDVCFGLGYNSFVLLSYILSMPSPPDNVEIVAIEKCEEPLSLIGNVLSSERFLLLSNELGRQDVRFDRTGTKRFDLQANERHVSVTFELIPFDIRQVVPSLSQSRPASFDLVFHDPFSPKRMPELWSVDLFSRYMCLLERPHGRVVTYSSAGAVRGGLVESGFSVWRTAAVGGKSGGTLAVVAECPDPGRFALPLSADEKLKIEGGSGIPYRDSAFSSSREEIRRNREIEKERFQGDEIRE